MLRRIAARADEITAEHTTMGMAYAGAGFAGHDSVWFLAGSYFLIACCHFLHLRHKRRNAS